MTTSPLLDEDGDGVACNALPPLAATGFVRPEPPPGADLSYAVFVNADFAGTNLAGADLSYAGLARSNPEAAASLAGAKTLGTKYLDDSQKAHCREKGAILDGGDAPP